VSEGRDDHEGDLGCRGIAGSPLLERDSVLAAIGRTLRRGASGQGATLFIVGEAGLGKTTILEEALRAAGGRFSIGHARGAASEGGLPFGLVDQALSQGAGDQGLRVASQEQHFYRALRQLRSLAAEGPVLLALDDLHWSDPDSLSLVHFLARRIGSAGVAIMATLRPWPSSAMDIAGALVAEGSATVEQLVPLSVGGVGRLLALIEGKEADRNVIVRVHRACAGNPLLVSQLSRTIHRPVDVSRPMMPSAELGQRYLLTRFADVGADGLKLLRAACVLGVRFRPEVAAAMVGLAPDVTTAILSGLQRAGLVRNRGTAHGEFVHDLFRQALYNDMTVAERRRLHEVALRALDAHPAVSAAEAAPHAIAARLAGDLQAIGVLERAAQEAVRTGAVRAAKAHLEAAVGLAGDDASAELLIELVRLMLADGDTDAAKALARRALVRAGVPAATRVVALDCLGHAHLADGDFVQAGRWYQAAEAEALRDSSQLAGATLLAHASQLFLASGPAGARDLALRARDLAGDLHPALRDQADVTASCLGYLAGNPAVFAGGAVAEELLFRATDKADIRPALPTCILYGLAVKAAERFAEFETMMAEIVKIAEKSSDPIPLSQALWHLADGAWRQGRLPRAAELIGQAQDLDDLVPVARPFTVAMAALVALDRGLLEEASRLLVVAEATSGPFSEMWLCLARGILHLRQGRVSQASALLCQLAEQVELTGLAEPCSIPWAAHAIQAATAARSIGQVESIVAWLDPLAGALACRWPQGTAAYGRAVLAEASRRLDEAEDLHGQSVRAHGQGCQPLAHAAALINQGAFLRRNARPREGRQPLACALRISETCGAGWYAQWARRELVQAGGRPSRRKGALTVQEAAVARFATAGLSNPDIASELYVSVKTVETHLSHVYAKLGVANRKQLREHPELLTR
jgi:DNA-binding CsgD family transcriptional regulator/tetratricopeptide (TPR) repeat protein